MAHRAHELEERCPLPGVSRRTGDGGRIPASCPLFGPCGSVRMCVFDGALFPGPRLSPATAGMAGCSRPVSVSPPGWPACPPEGAPDVLGFVFPLDFPALSQGGRRAGRIPRALRSPGDVPACAVLPGSATYPSRLRAVRTTPPPGSGLHVSVSAETTRCERSQDERGKHVEALSVSGGPCGPRLRGRPAQVSAPSGCRGRGARLVQIRELTAVSPRPFQAPA